MRTTVTVLDIQRHDPCWSDEDFDAHFPSGEVHLKELIEDKFIHVYDKLWALCQHDLFFSVAELYEVVSLAESGDESDARQFINVELWSAPFRCMGLTDDQALALFKKYVEQRRESGV